MANQNERSVLEICKYPSAEAFFKEKSSLFEGRPIPTELAIRLPWPLLMGLDEKKLVLADLTLHPNFEWDDMLQGKRFPLAGRRSPNFTLWAMLVREDFPFERFHLISPIMERSLSHFNYYRRLWESPCMTMDFIRAHIPPTRVMVPQSFHYSMDELLEIAEMKPLSHIEMLWSRPFVRYMQLYIAGKMELSDAALSSHHVSRYLEGSYQTEEERRALLGNDEHPKERARFSFIEGAGTSSLPEMKEREDILFCDANEDMPRMVSFESQLLLLDRAAHAASILRRWWLKCWIYDFSEEGLARTRLRFEKLMEYGS